MKRQGEIRRPTTVAAFTLLLYVCALVSGPVPTLCSRRDARSDPRSPGARVAGCEKGSCCTDRCTLDRNGIHHCVPAAGESCNCGISSGDADSSSDSNSNPVTLPELDCLFPILRSSRSPQILPVMVPDQDLSAPIPPPKLPSV